MQTKENTSPPSRYNARDEANVCGLNDNIKVRLHSCQVKFYNLMPSGNLKAYI